ncbi:hypothetical protein MIB92_14415 [Aestuariirhabdus sp. Z084]|uniref:hypothetical protein n=1 Tax=Aestuariirhabdus haliotis TaxID=2918751 RepID=UPI00201B425F|nr:hypothetical protein [Aestuariirhabdus haliotis]MCL6416851.1 hypothetical protein [Aestuariirhabdus haliotis]MCL6420873.1 hypothetical protein [Aestuariirhabdus haliotis]
MRCSPHPLLKGLFTVFIAGVSALLLSACIPHKQYRYDYAPCSSGNPIEDCQSNALQHYQSPPGENSDYLLTFIEFDDQGQLWDRQQLNRVIAGIQKESSERELLMVVFAHGWKHNAKAGDQNIIDFRSTLKKLSAIESGISANTKKQPRTIVGIYLGWRGGSVSLPVMKELSFWDRKNTAHKVGYGGVTEVLSRLEIVQKTKHSIAPDSSTRLVIIGHSFGGAVIYSALSELLENGFVQTKGPTELVSDTQGFADLVVLINPAFEAVRFSNLSDMSLERKSYFDSQLPVLAILTSEADNATRIAFPMGRWFSTLFEKERTATRYNPVTQQEQSIDQGKANITTVGHFDDYKTHYLSATPAIGANDGSNYSSLQEELALFVQASDSWENDHPGSKIPFNGSTLERTHDSAGRNPYLNIRVDAQLIPDHNHIYDPRIERFVRQLIMISSQPKTLESRQFLRSQTLPE